MSYPPEHEFINVNSTSGTFVTVLNITGSGILYWGMARCETDTGEIRITIDGYIQTFILTGNTTYVICFDPDSTINQIFYLGSASSVKGMPIWFQDNFLWEHRKVLGTLVQSKLHYGAL